MPDWILFVVVFIVIVAAIPLTICIMTSTNRVAKRLGLADSFLAFIVILITFSHNPWLAVLVYIFVEDNPPAASK